MKVIDILRKLIASLGEDSLPSDTATFLLMISEVRSYLKRQPESHGWTARVMATWKSLHHSYLPAYRLGVIKPIVEEHGVDVVIAALERYLHETSIGYASAARFAETFAKWQVSKPSENRFDNPRRQ